MHSSRMRAARSLTVCRSRSICRGVCMSCMPPSHTCPQPCMPPTPRPRTPLPCMAPQSCMPPSHTCPPGHASPEPCMPPGYACQPGHATPPPGYACLPVDGITNACKNITFANFVAGGNRLFKGNPPVEYNVEQ